MQRGKNVTEACFNCNTLILLSVGKYNHDLHVLANLTEMVIDIGKKISDISVKTRSAVSEKYTALPCYLVYFLQRKKNK